MKRLMGFHLIVALVLSLIFALTLMAQDKKEEEGVYTIKKGDTLWDISARFLKDPFLWPKLWQRNPYITNPHWIYPGNPVRLSAFEEVKKEEPKKVVEEKPKEVQVVKEVKPEPVEVKEVKKVEPPPVVEKKPEVIAEKKPEEEKRVIPEIRYTGFVAGLNHQGIGVVLDNRQGKNLMAEGDILYLSFKTAEPVLIGNKYTIFRAADVIRDPVTDKKIGRRYDITGNLEIIDQNGKFYAAKVIEAFQEILKGDMIQPYSKEKMEIGR